MSHLDAVLEACRIRLRPILMTSMAFIMGVVPLVFSSGAGFEIRQAMGIAVFAGMLGVTLFGLFLTPVFYTVIGRLTDRATRRVHHRADRQRRTGGRTLIMEPLSTPQLPTSSSQTWALGEACARSRLALSVSACAVRAPYKAPTVAPTTMKNADPALVVEQAFDPRWWGQFEDPVLDELVSRALTANHDVRIAVARLDQARAIFDDVKLDQYPTVTAGASVDRRSEQVPGFSEKPLTISSYRLGFDAFWEIDVFGRIRNQVRSAAATAESFQADVDDVRVIVAAEVARNYFELRGLQQRLAVAERSLSNQQETLRLTQVRRDAGIGEEQDVASAAARVAAIDAEHPADQKRDRAASSIALRC